MTRAVAQPRPHASLCHAPETPELTSVKVGRSWDSGGRTLGRICLVGPTGIEWRTVLLRCMSPQVARLGHVDSHQICPVLKLDRPCHRATACQSRLCDVDFPQKLMDLLPYKPISSLPKLANRTPFAFVVDSFLVRAADYSVGHRDR